MKYPRHLILVPLTLLALACGGDDGGGNSADATTGDTAPTDGSDGTDGTDGTENTESTGGNVEAGQMVYQQNCSVCHGVDGGGGVGSALTEEVPGSTDEELRQVVKEGKGSMPPFNHLTEEQLDDLIAYLRASFDG